MKKLILIILGIIALIIVSGGIWFTYTIKHLSYLESEEYNLPKIQEAVAKNDPTICDTEVHDPFMSGVSYKSNCYSQVAIQNKNLNACVNRGWPCFSVYFHYYQTNDQSLCNVIENQTEKDECYFQQSDAVHDTKLCSVIQSAQERNGCYINLVGLNKDATLCDKYVSGQQDKDICYGRAAGVFNDKKWCDKIQDPSQKQTCITVN